jgi:SAM-dependent methyltransferase
MANVFGEMGNYWMEIAEKHFTENQVQFLKGTLKKEGLILDLECGTARHAIALGNSGFNVVGLDASATLLKIAKKQSKAAQLVLGDIRFLPFKTSSFTSVVSMDTSFGYLPSPQDDLLCLSEIQKALVNGGLFVMDVFNKEKMLFKHRKSAAKRFSARLEEAFLRFQINHWTFLLRLWKWRDFPSFYLLQKRSVSVDGGLMRDFWVTRDKATGEICVFVHIVRLFGRNFLKDLLFKSGFSVDKVYGDYEKADFGNGAKRLILVGHKK